MVPNSSPCEQRTLCREHINRNTVNARSSLLTSWLSDSGVLTKRKMLNMRGLELGTAGLHRMSFRNMRKFYGTVNKITTILGKNIGC